jgi:hypothetical protein
MTKSKQPNDPRSHYIGGEIEVIIASFETLANPGDDWISLLKGIGFKSTSVNGISRR